MARNRDAVRLRDGKRHPAHCPCLLTFDLDSSDGQATQPPAPGDQ